MPAFLPLWFLSQLVGIFLLLFIARFLAFEEEEVDDRVDVPSCLSFWFSRFSKPVSTPMFYDSRFFLTLA